ncbi:MAG: hypothetical protein IT322_03320 [Anaerolineae bacterium]|nr:hypothetical protein [Anaerolineae bacterium]
MSYQEKRSLVSLVGTLLISALYGVFIYQRYPTGSPETSEVFKFWGAALLLFVPVQVVFKVILYVLLNVLNTIATREEEPEIADEMDRLIELKSVRNFCYVFMIGFFLAVGAPVVDLEPSVMFLILLITFVVCGAVLDISAFYFYRKGI